MYELIPKTLKVLGIDSDGNVWLWATDTRRVWSGDIDDVTKTKLVLLAGNEAVLEVEDEIKKIYEEANPTAWIKMAIANEARQKFFSASGPRHN